MGVYIKNMVMPRYCFQCEFNVCALLDNEKPENTSGCPLIEIDEATENHMLNLLEYAKDNGVNIHQAEKDLIIMDIVRCGECKHWYKNEPLIDEECNMFSNPDEFCSMGEKVEVESTLIKNIDAPKECRNCDFLTFDKDGHSGCDIAQFRNENSPNSCPLSEILADKSGINTSKDIVRCGECKHWTGDCTNEIWQSPTDDYLPQTNADDFCSYGERRADEN